MSSALHVLSVVHTVAHLDRAVAFFETVLGLRLTSRGEAFAVLDNGSLSVRLEQGHGATSPLRLELVATDLELATADLLAQEGIELVGSSRWLGPDRAETRVSFAHAGWNLGLILVRRFDEDELELVPELPTQLPWEPRALELVKRLLAEVPVAFRASARARVTERAETLAVEQGEVYVTVLFGVRAVVQVTPAFQLDRLKQSLVALELDPAEWAPDFERDGSRSLSPRGGRE